MTIKADPKALHEKHKSLIHSENQKVVSHVQREEGDWIVHTLMLENCDVPFQFKRQKQYQSLKGARVNLSYYTERKTLAGMHFEIMKVVRIRRA